MFVMAEIEYEELLKETDKAVLFNFGDREIWIPKSQIEGDYSDGSVTMSEWLAVENELID